MSPLTAFPVLVRGADSGAFTIAVIAALAIGSAALWGTFRYLARKRLVEDTPTALVRSAPQGYVELQGHAELMDGDPIHAPLSMRPCVWFRYKVEQRRERRSGDQRSAWRTIEQGVSDYLFYLTDHTGRCAVDPDGAAVTPAHRHVWYGTSRIPGRYHADDGAWWARTLGAIGQPYRYTEQRIEPGDAIYALGEFTTHGGGAVRFDREGAIGDRLREWKRDRAFLLREFDTDGDGHVDLAEWQAARTRAAAEVDAAQAGNAGPPPVDLLARARERRHPFVIAAGTEEALVHRCRLAAGSLLALAVPCLVGAAWAIVLRVGA
ncbi:MAG: GIDE domain-containing protein [Gammaproteobacteria bacterium]